MKIPIANHYICELSSNHIYIYMNLHQSYKERFSSLTVRAWCECGQEMTIISDDMEKKKTVGSFTFLIVLSLSSREVAIMQFVAMPWWCHSVIIIYVSTDQIQIFACEQPVPTIQGSTYSVVFLMQKVTGYLYYLKKVQVEGHRPTVMITPPTLLVSPILLNNKLNIIILIKY